jgi:hypothetical protein
MPYQTTMEHRIAILFHLLSVMRGPHWLAVSGFSVQYSALDAFTFRFGALLPFIEADS